MTSGSLTSFLGFYRGIGDFEGWGPERALLESIKEAETGHLRDFIRGGRDDRELGEWSGCDGRGETDSGSGGSTTGVLGDGGKRES